MKPFSWATLATLAPLVSALGQQAIVSFKSGDNTFQIAGGNVKAGQILVSSDDYWGVIRAAGDLAVDFGRVTGTNYTLSNGEGGAKPAVYSYAPVDVSNNTIVSSVTNFIRSSRSSKDASGLDKMLWPKME